MSALALIVAAAATLSAPPEVTTYFSPGGGTAAAIVTELAAATQTIDIVAYQLTNPELIDAIDAAALRGIAIRIVLDPENESAAVKRPIKLYAHQVPMRSDHAEKMQHSKYCVIDGRVTITGSYNWSINAERRNAENCVVIKDAPTAAAFTADFNRHWSHSRPYQPSSDRRAPSKTTHASAFQSRSAHP
jgi:phosphatidylserine/phosphatidylglycerophosphate/cardiolipin synthase-like enzyme